MLDNTKIGQNSGGEHVSHVSTNYPIVVGRRRIPCNLLLHSSDSKITWAGVNIIERKSTIFFFYFTQHLRWKGEGIFGKLGLQNANSVK